MSIMQWFQQVFRKGTIKHDKVKSNKLLYTKQEKKKVPLLDSDIAAGENKTTSIENLTENFIKQFQFNQAEECPFIYHEGNTQMFQCVLLVSKLALRHQKVKNLFPDDDTNVYFTTFPRDNPALISFMGFVLKKAMCVESFSIYGSDGNAILGELRTKSVSKEAESFQEKILQNVSENQFKEAISQLYEFSYTNFNVPVKQRYMNINAEFNLDVFGKLCEIMKIDSGVSVRWKKEFYLYSLVKRYYSDTIYQFRATWLENQSLDIFIPSLNVGIEYQGIQHYESVDLFGGEDEFQKRKINDTKKREKCRENGIRLIEWPYTDKISVCNLENKFGALGILVPHTQEAETKEHTDAVKESEKIEKAVHFLKEALAHDNLASMHYHIEKMAGCGNKEQIRKTLHNAISNFSEQKALAFFKTILQMDNNCVYQAICSDEKLLNYWADTGILNAYGRKIVFTLLKENPEGEIASKYLKKMRTLERKKGKKLNVASMNNILKKEAVANGISEEKIKIVLSKS